MLPIVLQYAWLRRLGFTVTNSRNIRGHRSLTMAAPRGIPTLPAGPSEELIHWLLVNQGPFILNWGDRNVQTTASSMVGAISRWEASGGQSIAFL